MSRTRSRERALLLALLAVVAAASHAAATPLSRLHDPVVVPVARLDGIEGTDSATLRLYRVRDGRWESIPYQFDARSGDGGLAVAGPVDFRLDADDELVFMAKDAGERSADGTRPAGADGAVEIELAEPRGDERGYAYLAAFASPPEVSFEPYVTYDVAAREARSAFYRVDYAAGRNFFTGVRIAEGAGGYRSNLLRQSRMRGSPTFSLLLTDVTLDFTEQNSVVEIEGVRTGPVRSVRRVKLSVDLGPLFPELPSGTSYTYHYLTSYATPTRIKFPWIMLQTLRDFRFENVLDFQPDVMPLTYHDAEHPGGIALAPAAPFEVRTTVDHEWWVHSGSAGTMLHAMVIPPAWRDWGVVRGTVVRSGGTDASARQSAAGYTLLNMTSLREAGAYDLLMASVVLPGGYAAGDEAGPMAMMNDPLVVSSHRMP
ncbi:MAG: hypothetical protein FJ148_16180 [Deltaproteobacteria bacterium]|nr:hypothetical protein [Deltaproteobacteria bacterium]